MAKGEIITLRELPLDIALLETELLKEAQIGGVSLKEARNHFESHYILWILEKVQGNQKEAAKLLGIHRNTLLQKMQRLRIRERPTASRT